MTGIPLTRCVFLVPFARILDEIGAPTTSLLAKATLPTCLEEKSTQYVPLFPALRWATTAQVSQGLADIGFLAGRRLGFEALHSQFQTSARHAPTLLAALESWCRFIQLEDNVLRLHLERHGHSLRVCFTIAIPRAERMPHLEHAQWLQNMMAICVVRRFAGSDWVPETFGFQARYSPTADTRSHWPKTRFLSGQRSTWIDIPVAQLSLPNGATNRRREENFEPTEPDIVGTLKLMLATYLDDRVPNIAEAAEVAGTSVRGLQRVLARADLTYSRLIDHVRFEQSTELLRMTDAKIIDVAYAVGYRDPSHFTRAFRRLAGVTPREFRQSTKYDRRQLETSVSVAR